MLDHAAKERLQKELYKQSLADLAIKPTEKSELIDLTTSCECHTGGKEKEKRCMGYLTEKWHTQVTLPVLGVLPRPSTHGEKWWENGERKFV